VHVGFCPETGEFSGLPETWARILTQSNLSMNEKKNNPEAVLQVLDFYANNKKPEDRLKWMGGNAWNSNYENNDQFSNYEDKNNISRLNDQTNKLFPNRAPAEPPIKARIFNVIFYR